MKPTMKELLLALLESYNELINCRGTPEDPHPPLVKEFFSVKGQSTKYKMQKTFPTTAGESEHNMKKNRYKDILPFDYTRVILSELDGVPGSDYINANYLKGHDGKPVYIAAQGPLPQTVVDFWRMIWESNTQILVMSCNEYELGKHKCQKYWSEPNETLQFGEIKVQQISQEFITKDFLIRKLIAFKGENEKEYFQFHYTSWPDHGVPTTVEAIINMVKKMREYQDDDDQPLLIHCSAGCGRTGTLCVIDYIRNLLRDEMIDENFSLKSIILEMRTQRHAIVQTKEQYELVHKAAAALFRETLQDKFGMTFDDGHTYENWTLDELVRPDTPTIPSQPVQQPVLPRKPQSDADSPKVNIPSKPNLKLKPLKPPILTNKPSSPIPVNRPVLPSSRLPEATNSKVGKPKQDSLAVTPTPTQRRSYDSVVDNLQAAKSTAYRLSDTESRITGVQNLLLQQRGNLTGGLQMRPDVSKRLSVDANKPPESAKPQTERKPNPRNLSGAKVLLHQPAQPVRNTATSGGCDTVSPDQTAASGHEMVQAERKVRNTPTSGVYENVSPDQILSGYEVVQPERKVPPSKPKRRQHDININRRSPERRSLPSADSLTSKPSKLPPMTSSLGNGEYAYVDHKSHIGDLIERERESGTVENQEYESVDLDPNYAHTGLNSNSKEEMVPYAYTDINSEVLKKSDRRSVQRNTAAAYEDIDLQDIDRPKPVVCINQYPNQESAYAEVSEFPPLQDTRAPQSRLTSVASTGSSANSGWSFTDDSFDDEDNTPVVPERTREMYQTIDELEETMASSNTSTKHFAPFATLNKIFTKNRPKIPDFFSPQQTVPPQQPQQQQKVGEHGMEVNEAIRNATFSAKDTYVAEPIIYQNIDISFPRKVPKPKLNRNSPWHDSYSMQYP